MGNTKDAPSIRQFVQQKLPYVLPANKRVFYCRNFDNWIINCFLKAGSKLFIEKESD